MPETLKHHQDQRNRLMEGSFQPSEAQLNELLSTGIQLIRQSQEPSEGGFTEFGSEFTLNVGIQAVRYSLREARGADFALDAQTVQEAWSLQRAYGKQADTYARKRAKLFPRVKIDGQTAPQSPTRIEHVIVETPSAQPVRKRGARIY